MAIIKKIELDNGIKVDSAYFRVANVNCDKDFMDFKVNIYKDKESRIGNKAIIDSLNYICKHDISNNASNVIKQAYEHLKSLKEYENSLDDLEY